MMLRAKAGGQSRPIPYFRRQTQAQFKPDWVSALDLEGRKIWIVDAHGYGKRFIVRPDEKLTAFPEMQRGIHQFAVDLIS
jgi:hypothetical protein